MSVVGETQKATILPDLFGELNPSIFPAVIDLPPEKILKVTMQLAKIIAWAGIAFCSLFSLLSFATGRPFVAIFCFLFILLGLFLLSICGSIEMGSQKITLKIPIGHYEIRWDEIEEVETDIQRGALVFLSCNKRVAIAGPRWWVGQEKKDMISFLNSELKRRSISIRQSRKALFKLSKNSKVHKG